MRLNPGSCPKDEDGEAGGEIAVDCTRMYGDEMARVRLSRGLGRLRACLESSAFDTMEGSKVGVPLLLYVENRSSLHSIGKHYLLCLPLSIP